MEKSFTRKERRLPSVSVSRGLAGHLDAGAPPKMNQILSQQYVSVSFYLSD